VFGIVTKYILLLFILVPSVEVLGATLKGVVLYNELGGQPAPNVQLTGATGANPAATDSLGRFTLEFPSMMIGDNVTLIVRLAGYEVVNDIQTINLSLPREPATKPLIVLICKTGLREEMARRFYRLKSLVAIEAEYKTKLAQLEKQNLTDTAATSKLLGERALAHDAANALADELAKHPASESSALYRRAMQLFLAGDVDGALSVLDDKALTLSMKEAKDNKRRADEAIGEAVRAYLLKAQLSLTRLDFASAEFAYQEAIDAVPSDFLAHFGLAYLQQLRHQDKDAIRSYELCRTLTKNPALLSASLNNLGNAYLNIHDADSAQSAMNNALTLRRELAKDGSDVNRRELAATLDNMANIDVEYHHFAEAWQSHEDAFNIRLALAQRSPNIYLGDLLESLTNLASLAHRQRTGMGSFKPYFDRAFPIMSDVKPDVTNSFLPNIAAVLDNVGNLIHSTGDYMRARIVFKNSLRISRVLASRTPEMFDPLVAHTLANLSVLDRDDHDLTNARAELEEATALYQKLSTTSPETFLPEVVAMSFNAARLDAEDNRLEKAEDEYKLLLERLRALSEANALLYRPLLARALNDFGRVQFIQGRLTDALRNCNEGLNIHLESAKKQPDLYRPYVAHTLVNIGIIYLAQKKPEEARKKFVEALGIFKEFAKGNPGLYSSDVTDTEQQIDALPIQ